MHPFHLAFPVRDIASTRAFYCRTLGRPEARSAERWIDIDFWGHQLSAHVVDAAELDAPANAVDGRPCRRGTSGWCSPGRVARAR